MYALGHGDIAARSDIGRRHSEMKASRLVTFGRIHGRIRVLDGVTFYRARPAISTWRMSSVRLPVLQVATTILTNGRIACRAVVDDWMSRGCGGIVAKN